MLFIITQIIALKLNMRDIISAWFKSISKTITGRHFTKNTNERKQIGGSADVGFGWGSLSDILFPWQWDAAANF